MQARQNFAHALNSLDDVGAGLFQHKKRNRRLAIGHAVIARVLHRIAHLGHIAQPHRRAIAVAEDDRRVFGRSAGLVVGADLPGPVAVFQRTLGPVRIGGGECQANVVQRNALRRQFIGVEFYPHGGQCATAHAHLAHALHLCDALCQHGGGGVIHLATRQRVRRHRQNHDGRISRVHLAVARIAGHASG